MTRCGLATLGIAMLWGCSREAPPNGEADLAEATRAVLSGWTCPADASVTCSWDCTGGGLALTTPGHYAVDLTSACTLRLRAWGGGGGGGQMSGVYGEGGGGGGTVVLTDDGTWPGLPWVIGGGGGAGAGGPPPSDGTPWGGGGGGGGYGEMVAEYPAGARLHLVVGGGGRGSCWQRSPNREVASGGEPDPGTQERNHANFGGGASDGASQFGGGGGRNAYSIWGGGGGQPWGSDFLRDPATRYGLPGTPMGPDREGGGGGGGGGLGTVVQLGETGAPGHLGAGGGAGGGPAVKGAVPGGGGDGNGDVGPHGEPRCGGHGGDGRLELLVEPAGTGETCPVDRVGDCAGGCAISGHLGDGVCDVALDCPAHGRDGGDCPEDAWELPDWMVDRCPAVASQDAFCFSLHMADTYVGPLTFVMIGLDDGSPCELGDMQRFTSTPGGNQWQSAAWVPPYRSLVRWDNFYGDEMLQQFDIRQGWFADAPHIEPWKVGFHHYPGKVETVAPGPLRDGIALAIFDGDPFGLNDVYEVRGYPSFGAFALHDYQVLLTDQRHHAGFGSNLGEGLFVRKEGGTDGADNVIEIYDLATNTRRLLELANANPLVRHYGIDVVGDRIWLAGSAQIPIGHLEAILESYDLHTGAAGPRFVVEVGADTNTQTLYTLGCYEPNHP